MFFFISSPLGLSFGSCSSDGVRLPGPRTNGGGEPAACGRGREAVGGAGRRGPVRVPDRGTTPPDTSRLYFGFNLKILILLPVYALPLPFLFTPRKKSDPSPAVASAGGGQAGLSGARAGRERGPLTSTPCSILRWFTKFRRTQEVSISDAWWCSVPLDLKSGAHAHERETVLGETFPPLQKRSLENPSPRLLARRGSLCTALGTPARLTRR